MTIDALLSLVESYITLKMEPMRGDPPQVSDWDCGLAAELEGSYADDDRRERLTRLRGALEKALNDYIDRRVQMALADRMEIAGGSAPMS
ncbi:MAG: hypothetical protein MUF52_12725 [Syntrophobacteraceae bacterium]|nr:hypothetical protein [Syntrophobacteraceae bacterium]